MSSSPAVSTAEKIRLDFRWQGQNSWRGGWDKGGLDVLVVDLTFKNAHTDVSVHLPQNISSNSVQHLPFTCRKYHGTTKSLDKETTPEVLIVKVEHVRALTLKAGFFEESPNKGPMTMDLLGKVTQEKRALRTDSEIKLEIPEELEAGALYHLMITSDPSFSLTAKLIKTVQEPPEEKVSNITTETTTDDAQKIADIEELSKTLGELGVVALLGLKKMEFSNQLLNHGVANQVKFSSSITEIYSLTAVLAKTFLAIERQTKSLDANSLKTAMLKIRAMKAEALKNPLKKDELGSAAAKECFNLVGKERLENICRANIMDGLEAPISSSVEAVITQICQRFSEICMKRAV